MLPTFSRSSLPPPLPLQFPPCRGILQDVIPYLHLQNAELEELQVNLNLLF